jgi:hypothetical protein
MHFQHANQILRTHTSGVGDLVGKPVGEEVAGGGVLGGFPGRILLNWLLLLVYTSVCCRFLVLEVEQSHVDTSPPFKSQRFDPSEQ